MERIYMLFAYMNIVVDICIDAINLVRGSKLLMKKGI